MTAENAQVGVAEAAVTAAASEAAAVYSTPSDDIGTPVQLPSVPGPMGSPKGLNYGSAAPVSDHGDTSPNPR